MLSDRGTSEPSPKELLPLTCLQTNLKRGTITHTPPHPSPPQPTPPHLPHPTHPTPPTYARTQVLLGEGFPIRRTWSARRRWWPRCRSGARRMPSRAPRRCTWRRRRIERCRWSCSVLLLSEEEETPQVWGPPLYWHTHTPKWRWPSSAPDLQLSSKTRLHAQESARALQQTRRDLARKEATRFKCPEIGSSPFDNQNREFVLFEAARFHPYTSTQFMLS